MADVNITVNGIFHHEGPLAVPALASMRDMVAAARAAGLRIQAQAVLDRPNELTREVVARCGDWLDAVHEVSFGDLGLSRNAGLETSVGEFCAFLDGDDLWGADWLTAAHAVATAPNAPADGIWHPQWIYYFDESDFDRHSQTETPNRFARSFFMIQESSVDAGFDRDVLFINNIWTANVFVRRRIYERFPYAPVDRTRGFGIEDWQWHMQTLWSGLPHCVVPNAVHLTRLKETASLGQRNDAEGLLVVFPAGATPKYSPEPGALP